MRSHVRSIVAACVLAAPLVGATHAQAADPQEKVHTYFRLLVGHVDPSPGGGAVVVVPGTVVVPGDSAGEKATDVLRVIDQLRDAYRLGKVEPAQSSIIVLQANQPADVPSVAGGPQIQATLLASDETSATYRIALTEKGERLAEPAVRVPRGGRAIVGSRNGDAAPYLFVVIEPLPPAPPKVPRPAGGATADQPITEPKLLKRVTPAYPPEAKNARLEGVVLLEAVVGRDGRVKDVKVARGEPMGLSEAAIDAVKQWEFEPARNAKGQAVDVIMTLTIRFALR